jgi:methionyl-tRNA formyltransferase
MRIAILCNDRLALPALNQLAQSGLLAAVGVTDRSNETQMLVKQMCAQGKIPVQEFAKNSFNADLGAWLMQHQPDVVLVKTFPWRIPAECLPVPKHGFINFHYAPLPEWRGSNPLFWMIRNRASTAGVSVHKMTEELDKGDLLFSQQLSLSPETTFGMLCTQLAYAGLELNGKLLQGLMTNTLKPQPQDHSKAKWYGRPKPADLFIDWNTMPMVDIRALVKACNPWNKGAGTKGNGWTFGITDVSLSPVKAPDGTLPGTILEMDDSKGLVIACCDNKTIRVDVIYCEEGFYPGHRLALFGFRKGGRLGS